MKMPKNDAMERMDNILFKDSPERRKDLEKEILNARVAGMVYELREKLGLTQSELAKRVGTTQSVISRLEDSDYDGHSLSMLHRIACACGKRLKVEFEEPETIATSS